MTYPPREVVDGLHHIGAPELVPQEPELVTRKPDGRRLRAERTRAAIVDALHALIEDGDLKPTAPRIAQRAHVSLRTVFQHFAEMEHLFAALSERQVTRVAATVEPIDPTLPLAERVDAYAAQRCRVLEEVTPVARAAAMQEPFSARVHAESERLRALAHDEVVATFASELDGLPEDRRALLLAALLAGSTWRMWEVLRTEQALEPEAARAVVVYQLGAVLAAEGFDGASG